MFIVLYCYSLTLCIYLCLSLSSTYFRCLFVEGEKKREVKGWEKVMVEKRGIKDWEKGEG